MEQVYSAGVSVEKTSFGLANVAEESATSHVAFADILRVIIWGELSQVETLEGSKSLHSVFFSLQEVSEVLGLQTGDAGVTISDAARYLRLSSQAVTYILSTKDGKDEPYLETCGQLWHVGKMRDNINSKLLDEFKSKYQKLTDFCELKIALTNQKRSELEAMGIYPEWNLRNFKVEYFRVSDL